MEKTTYKVMLNANEQEDIINIFKDELLRNPKYQNAVDEELISVEKGYLAYDFYYGKINDLEYLVVQDDKKISGKLNVEIDMPSAMFLMNGLSRTNVVEVIDDIENHVIFNHKDLDKNKNLFLKRILSRTEDIICKRHNVFIKRKNQKLDISPIRKFDEYNQEIYLEPVYRIHARSKRKKKTMISVYSGISNRFYELDYLYSEEYDSFYKRFRSPIVYVPKYLMDEYYDIAFDVYSKTIKEVRYIKESELYKKIKENIRYKDYSKYRDYLYQAIFYFRKSGYLRDYYVEYENNNIKKRLLDLYLTLSFQEKSGLILAEYNQLGLCEYNDIKEWLYFLKKSYHLGNLEAKKILFDHYLKPNYYDEYYLKRYS